MELRVGEDGHDIFEEDARRGEVGVLPQRGSELHLETGEFGGGGGIGGGESSLGGIFGCVLKSGGGVGFGGRWVRGRRGFIGCLGGGGGVFWVTVGRMLV